RSLCFDEKSGTNFYKVQSCSIKSNVFARKLLWCGKDYIEIVDIATNKTVSLINNDRNSKNPSLDIILLDDKPKYCEYCYNGVMDEDEEERDCGGSCKPCGIQESYWMTLLQRVMWSLKF
ncbi:MAG: hypothetical protein WCP89_00435, partial [archaeon]